MNRQPTYGAISPASSEIGFSDRIATEFNTYSESIVTNIYTINSSIRSLESAIKLIGTKKDNHGVRDKIHITQISANQIASATSKDIQKLKKLVDKRDKQRQLQVEKLEGNFKEAIARYHNLQKIGAEKQKSHLLIPTENNEDTENATEEEQIQAQKMREIAFEQDMLIDRESRIMKIESDILDVNQIMRELGSIVHQQGETIDSIENSIDHTAGVINEGAEQLIKASRYQRSQRKKMFILVTIALIIATILMTVLIVELGKK